MANNNRKTKKAKQESSQNKDQSTQHLLRHLRHDQNTLPDLNIPCLDSAHTSPDFSTAHLCLGCGDQKACSEEASAVLP